MWFFFKIVVYVVVLILERYISEMELVAIHIKTCPPSFFVE